MKRIFKIYLVFFIGLVIGLGSISDVYAKRMGGGRSFGSRSIYSQPYKRPANTPALTQRQQQTHAQNQAARDALSKRGGWRSMLGGLALGGLLGALFFGGAFEGINLFDIVALAGVALLLMKLLSARTAARPEAMPSYGQFHRDANEADNSNFRNSEDPVLGNRQDAGFDTDILFKNNKTHGNRSSFSDAVFDETEIPSNFDQAQFLNGAKIAFKRLQSAWDNRDLADIRSLTTDKVFAEIQEQLQVSDLANRTDVLKLDAELLSYRETGSDTEVSVLFDAIMRENSAVDVEQVREVWHFIRPKHSLKPTWYLDGIQQLEN